MYQVAAIDAKDCACRHSSVYFTITCECKLYGRPVVDWTVRLQLPAIKLQHDHSVTRLLHALLTTLTYLLTFFQVTWLQAAMIPEVSLLTD